MRCRCNPPAAAGVAPYHSGPMDERAERGGAADERRRDQGFVWVSTGRRIASARVGRRWVDIRGPLLAAAALALLQAALIYVSLRVVQELGLSLFLLVP